MYEHLYNFLVKHEILYNLQFSFHTSHSVNHALVSLTEAIKNSLDNRKFGCGIFIDLQKAFDTMNHDILLIKLEQCGIRGTILIDFIISLHQLDLFINMVHVRLARIIFL